jgi:hypothetical protein
MKSTRQVAMLISLLATTFSFSVVSQSRAATDGRGEWLIATAAIRESNEMNAKKMLPATIDCRFRSITSSLVSYELRFTYKANRSKKLGHWQVGNDKQIAHEDATQRKRGYHRIFTKTIQDPESGERASCVIWLN